MGFACGLLAVLSIETAYYYTSKFTLMDSLGQLSLSTISYIFLGYCYFHFVNLGETARRIRILRELYDSKDGLSINEILKRYDANKIIEMRIDRLASNGQIVLKNGRYYIDNPAMLFMTKIIITMKLIVLGKRSEFN